MDNDELKEELKDIRLRSEALLERVAKLETKMEDSRDDIRDIMGGIEGLYGEIDKCKQASWFSKGVIKTIVPVSIALMAAAISLFTLLH
jgi:chromosome segregation ATPase